MAEKKVETKFKDVEIKNEGAQIILPEKMSMKEGITWLERKIKEDETTVNLHEAIDVLPLEGAHAFSEALKIEFGFVSVKPPSWFTNPPVFVDLEVGFGQKVQVLWGPIEVPGLDGYLQPGVEVANGRIQFVIEGEIKQKHRARVIKVVDQVRRQVAEHSIYKGKAIQLGFANLKAKDFNPILFQHRFLDISKVDPGQLIFPDRVARMVEDTLFTPIRHTAACRAAKIPLKRGILLEGPFGVGKTLTQYVTAKYAVENGWTYIAVDDTTRLAEALQFAKKYQPAIVAAEDIDRADEDGARSDQMNAILNTIDGASFKDTEIIVILTTNHVEKITRAMLRPGRLDAVIPVRPPDAKAVERLVKLYAGATLAPEEDLSTVGQKLAGNIPAVVREVVERSKLSAITRVGSTGSFALTAPDLDAAADGMLEHLELLKESTPDVRSDIEKAAGVLVAGLKEINNFGVGDFDPTEREIAELAAALSEA